MAKVSIIIPIYNTEKYLSQCLDTVIAQTLHDIEIICVNDGSTDSSLNILREYEQKDNRFVIIDKENGGSNSARKAGLNIATGEYVGFLDSDDWIDESMFEELMAKADETEADIVISGYVREEKNSSTVFFDQCEEGYYDKRRMQNELFHGFIAYGTDWVNQRIIHPNFVNKVFKKNLLKPILDEVDDRIIWCEDMVTVYTAILNADSIYVIKKAFYHYRKNESSVSYRRDRRALDLYPLAVKELLKLSDKFGGNIEKQLGYCFTYDLSEMLRIVFGMNYHKFYLFPMSLFDKEDSIVIYGAGAVGWSYYSQASKQDYFNNVIWTDSNKEKCKGKIVVPKDAFESPYDKVLIAVENEGVSLQIKRILIEKYDIPEGKIYWRKPQVVDGTFSYHYD